MEMFLLATVAVLVMFVIIISACQVSTQQELQTYRTLYRDTKSKYQSSLEVCESYEKELREISRYRGAAGWGWKNGFEDAREDDEEDDPEDLVY